jgi:GTP cyclohydrolase I
MAIDDAYSPPALLPPKTVDRDSIESAIHDVLIGLGQSGKAEVMARTPRRVADLYAEMINPPDVDVEDELKTFPNPGMDDLVIVNDVHYVSMCEHHLAPAFGIAHLAYVPHLEVVGYSKLKKALNYLARQPQLNERLVVDVLDFIEARLEPRGLALVLRSVHCCIALRTNAPAQELVTVSGYRGCLKTDPHRRAFDQTWLAGRPSFLGA